MMFAAIRQIYARILPFMLAVPAVLLIPIAAEMTQHVAEIRLGMYANGALSADARQIRLAFGIVKIAALVVTLLFALRFWSFDGNWRRAARPTGRLFAGIGAYILVVLVFQLLQAALGWLLITLPGFDSNRPLKIAVTVALLLVSVFLQSLFLPWVVGLMVEDRSMTLKRSVAGMRGHIWQAFGLLIAGVLPLMAVHFALGYVSIGATDAATWTMMAIDSVAAVPTLIIAIASTYLTIYRLAAGRTEARDVGHPSRPNPLPAGEGMLMR